MFKSRVNLGKVVILLVVLLAAFIITSNFKSTRKVPAPLPEHRLQEQTERLKGTLTTVALGPRPRHAETNSSNDRASNMAAVRRGGPEFYVITMLSIFNGKRWPKYENYTIEELKERDDEYMETLEFNINREFVKEVHLFYLDDSALQLVNSRNFTNRYKIVPVKHRRRLHMADFFIYSSRNLIDKAVIAINSDIMLGKGFELINTERMRDEKVLYSLTRHGAIKKSRKPCNTDNMCLDKQYQGSHDTHIFRLGSPLNETLILDRLDYPINMWQAENGMLWTFRYLLNYIVRNPCKVLETYHNHCSKVHGPQTTPDHQYSILTLPNKGWSRQMMSASLAKVEDSLAYGRN